MKFYCFVATILATTGYAHAYNLAQSHAEEAIFDDNQLAESYAEKDGDPAPATDAT